MSEKKEKERKAKGGKVGRRDFIADEKGGVSRREFIAGTVAGVAGVAVGAAAGSQLFPRTKEVTVGVDRFPCPYDDQVFTTEQALGDHIKTAHPDLVTKEVIVEVPPPTIKLTVNGEQHELEVGGQVDPWHTLAYTLRETLGLTGTKIACDEGACGDCAVLVDGKPILSCMALTVECDGKSVTTIEGLADPKTGELHPLQQAFVDNTAFQCGFCTPGIIMSTKALLDEKPSPTEEEVKEALAGHFCRCISHYHVLRAVMAAVGK